MASDARSQETPAPPAPPIVGTNDAAYCPQYPDLERAFLILLPLLFTKRTASTLNSFVNVRCSFGMMPSFWRLSSKFISSGKVSQCHRGRTLRQRSWPGDWRRRSSSHRLVAAHASCGADAMKVSRSVEAYWKRPDSCPSSSEIYGWSMSLRSLYLQSRCQRVSP